MNSLSRQALITALATLAAVATLPVAGCSSSDASDGADADGASGASDGVCTWDDNLAREAGLKYASGPTRMKVGDIYASADGCNGCGCTAEGFRCTKNVCAFPVRPEPTCAEDTNECPDGSRIRRELVICTFTIWGCSRGPSCTGELRTCPGSDKTVGRSGPFCTLTPCN